VRTYPSWVVGVAVLVWSSAASPQVFQSQGPGPRFGTVELAQSADSAPYGHEAGAIQAIVLDPALGANTIFAGSVNGGVWVTRNGGTTWTPLTDKQASLSVASLALDPLDPTGRTLVAGIGITSNGVWEESGGVQGRGGQRTGLLYTTDGGATWSALGGATLAGQSVIGTALRGNIILAATFEEHSVDTDHTSSGTPYGLYRSTNGGASFSLVTQAMGLPSGAVTSLVADPANQTRFYASVTSVTNRGETAVYVSNNSGASWSPVFTQANSGGTITSSVQTVLTLATGPNGSLAVAVSTMGSPHTFSGLFLSQDSGQTWHQLQPPHLPDPVSGNHQTPVNLHVAIDPGNPNIVYLTGEAQAVGVQAYRVVFDPSNNSSSYASLTFEGALPYSNANTVHADSRAIVFDASGRMLLSSDGGIYARDNPQGSGAWQNLNGNLSAFEPIRIAYDANSKRLVVAAQDNGVSLQSAPGNPLHNALHEGDGTNAAVNDRTLGSLSAIYFSSDKLEAPRRLIVDSQGNIVSPVTSSAAAGIHVTCDGQLCKDDVGGSFRSPFVLNSVDPRKIAIGGDIGVFITTDSLTGPNAPSATTIDLSLNLLGAPFVSAIAYGTRDNVDALVAGTQISIAHLYRSLDGGTVSQLTNYAGGTPTSIVFDQRTAQRYYIADGGNVWGTRNGATADPANVTFQQLTGNLPAGFIRPSAVEFISNTTTGVNALLVGGLNVPLSCDSTPNGCVIGSQQSPITVADSDGNGNLTGWRAFGQGLPNALVTQLVYNPTVDVLAAALVGRGAWVLYDVTSYFPQATVLQFGLADNDSMPDASFLTNGSYASRALIKYGAGTLTIAGPATYTGGTTINNGILQIGNGGASGSILGDVVFCANAGDPQCNPGTNKALAFNRSDTYTFAGAISGPGELLQFGTGKTILTGASTYSGPTFVDAGSLIVNGSIVSPVYVDAGGTLGGNGTVGSVTVLPGGTLSPGNSIGTITINGSLTFNSGSLHLIEIAGSTVDRTNVAGTATLAGVVGLSYLGGNVTSTRYTILSAAGGLGGTTYDSVMSFASFINASLAYSPTDVQVNLVSGLRQLPGLTPNQASVASTLDSSFNAGGGTLPNLFGLAASQLPAALSLISGEGISGAQETAFGAGGSFLVTMMNQGQFWRSGDAIDVTGVNLGAPMQYAARTADHPVFKAMPLRKPTSVESRWRAWMAGFDGTWSLAGEASSGSASLSHRTAAVAGGMDFQWAPDLLTGFALGGSTSSFSVPDRATSGTLEGAHLGAYGVKTFGASYASAAIGFAAFNNMTSRSIAVGAQQMATATFGSELLSSRLEFGFKQKFAGTAVTPFVAMQFSKLWQGGFTESTGANALGPLGLNVAATTAWSLPTFLGAQVDKRIELANGMVLAPYGRISWVHEFSPNRRVSASFAALPGTSFTVDGPRATTNAAAIDIGAKLAVNPRAWLFAGFTGEFAHRSQSYAGKGGVRVNW
jgi:outer membrane autotransporter protein